MSIKAAREQGYTDGSPSETAEMIDRSIVEDDNCPKCGSKMRYVPLVKWSIRLGGLKVLASYRAFGKCSSCDFEFEF